MSKSESVAETVFIRKIVPIKIFENLDGTIIKKDIVVQRLIKSCKE